MTPACRRIVGMKRSSFHLNELLAVIGSVVALVVVLVAMLQSLPFADAAGWIGLLTPIAIGTAAILWAVAYYIREQANELKGARLAKEAVKQHVEEVAAAIKAAKEPK